ncbi:hypothetical protein CKM354_001025900 [Cercospora kikuchii]|uniref:DUF7223 domain-containing protein n=1 Tax=Cercospora kikuchii TaxID=84275 RepID=A0A9P3FKT1_9PEZI|nr:uncharacterized protein CKM354_001025900 [Cercospora kikuchii]GIZ47160.1 hypothetical protein CKM354_001025900 [Cercospora kikuchii]
MTSTVTSGSLTTTTTSLALMTTTAATLPTDCRSNLLRNPGFESPPQRFETVVANPNIPIRPGPRPPGVYEFTDVPATWEIAHSPKARHKNGDIVKANVPNVVDAAHYKSHSGDYYVFMSLDQNSPDQNGLPEGDPMPLTIKTSLRLSVQREYRLAFYYALGDNQGLGEQCTLAVALNGRIQGEMIGITPSPAGTYVRAERTLRHPNAASAFPDQLVTSFVSTIPTTAHVQFSHAFSFAQEIIFQCKRAGLTQVDLLLDDMSLVDGDDACIVAPPACSPAPSINLIPDNSFENVNADPNAMTSWSPLYGPSLSNRNNPFRRQVSSSRYKAQDGSHLLVGHINSTTWGSNLVNMFFYNMRLDSPYRLSFHHSIGELQSFGSVGCDLNVRIKGAAESVASFSHNLPLHATARPGQWEYVEWTVQRIGKVATSQLTFTVQCGDGSRVIDPREYDFELLLDNISLVDLNECRQGPAVSTTISRPSNTNTRGPNDATATCGRRPNAYPVDASGGESKLYNKNRDASPAVLDTPFIPCGTSFDQELDFAYGYLKWDSGLKGNDSAIYSYLGWPSELEVLTYRQRVSGKANVLGLMQAVKNLAGFVGDITSLINAAVEGITKVVDFFATIRPSIGFTIPLNMFPPGFAGSSFDGNNILLYTAELGEKEAGFSAAKSEVERIVNAYGLAGKAEPRVNLWCVDCGLTGELTVAGSASISVINGPTSLRLELGGNIAAGMHLGLEAYVEKEAEFKKKLGTVALPGLSIPGIITVGPLATFSVDGKVGVAALGRVLLGGKVEFPQIKAVLDVIDLDASELSGFKPTFTPRFEAGGELTISSSLGMPISVGIGIDILNGAFEKGVALVTRPYIGTEIHWNTPPIGTGVDEDGCDGIDWSLGIGTEFEMDVFDNSIAIGQWEGPKIAEGCLGNTIPDAEESKPVSPENPNEPATAKPKENPIYQLPPVEELMAGQPIAPAPGQATDVPVAEGQARLRDVSDKVNLIAGDDGSLYLGSQNTTSSLFAQGLNIVYGADKRYLAWHPDTMGAYGISRLRLVDEGTALFGQLSATLVPVRAAQRNVYLVLGAPYLLSETNFYSLAWCNSPLYKGSKIFMVRNFDDAMQRLKSPEVQWIVTGAEISECGPLILKHDLPPLKELP